MALLPLNRLDAFTRIAVDFGGPFITMQGRGRRRENSIYAVYLHV